MRSRIIEAEHSQAPPMVPEVGITLTTRREYKHILPGVLGYLKDSLIQIETERAERNAAPVRGWSLARVIINTSRIRQDILDDQRVEQVVDRIAEIDDFLADIQSRPGLSAGRSFDLTLDETNQAADYMGIHNLRLPPDVRAMHAGLAIELESTRGQEYSRLYTVAEADHLLGQVAVMAETVDAIS